MSTIVCAVNLFTYKTPPHLANNYRYIFPFENEFLMRLVKIRMDQSR